MIFIGILVAIFMFSIIVIIHELGHFSAARKFGIKVEEFGLGIPPKAKKIFTDKKGTNYTLNWLPLGGFVRLKGEDPSQSQDKNDPETFSNKSYFAKSIVLLAGVFMNFLLATIIFSVLFFIGVKPIGINSKIDTDLDLKIIPTQEQALKSGLLIQGKGVLLYPIKNSVAEKSGIIKADILTAINGENINTPQDAMAIIRDSSNTKLSLTILRKMCETCSEQPKKYSINIVPSPDGKIGSYLAKNISLNNKFEYKYSAINSVKHGILETYNQSLLTFKAVGILIRKIVRPETPKERTEAIENMKGPIGIVDLVAHSLDAGVIFLFILGAIISINLGVFNLLPIPALDGGRFLMLSINTLLKKIFGKVIINNTIENVTHIFFFIILIALSLLIGYNDVINILNR